MTYNRAYKAAMTEEWCPQYKDDVFRLKIPGDGSARIIQHNTASGVEVFQLES